MTRQALRAISHRKDDVDAGSRLWLDNDDKIVGMFQLIREPNLGFLDSSFFTIVGCVTTRDRLVAELDTGKVRGRSIE